VDASQFEKAQPFGKVPRYFAINMMSAKGLWAVRLPEYRFDYRPDA
jgi:hypothetical protein